MRSTAMSRPLGAHVRPSGLWCFQPEDTKPGRRSNTGSSFLWIQPMLWSLFGFHTLSLDLTLHVAWEGSRLIPNICTGTCPASAGGGEDGEEPCFGINRCHFTVKTKTMNNTFTLLHMSTAQSQRKGIYLTLGLMIMSVRFSFTAEVSLE